METRCRRDEIDRSIMSWSVYTVIDYITGRNAITFSMCGKNWMLCNILLAPLYVNAHRLFRMADIYCVSELTLMSIKVLPIS